VEPPAAEAVAETPAATPVKPTIDATTPEFRATGFVRGAIGEGIAGHMDDPMSA